MKRFKVNRVLFMIIPGLILVNIIFYIFVMLKKSYPLANWGNLSLDVVILLYYLTKFCYEVSIDSEGANFYTIFGKIRVNNDDIINVRQSPFLTRIKGSSGVRYIITSPRGRDVLKNMFQDIDK